MRKLYVIIASTRPGRAGLPIGRWAFDYAQKHGGFDVELVDLKEVNLPLLDEPKHPRLRQYEHAHTKAWSQKIDAADAFVFVTPEYNYGAPPALINALDFIYAEWAYKPAAFVSYGGASGGLRSVQMLKQVLTTLKIMPLPDAVSFTFFQKLMREDGSFGAEESHEKAAKVMLDELLRWTNALAPMRGQ